ncbi:MAG: TrmH family RNA methyltransferase [Candidatus Heimdallarchaeota archaeon]
MYLLVKLARFITPQEQVEISNEIEKSSNQFITVVQVRNDTWATKNRLIVELKLESPDSPSFNVEQYVQALLKKPGLASAVIITTDMYNWESKSFSMLINALTEYLNVNETSEFNLEFVSIGKVPFHRKAIIDRLKKRNLRYLEKINFVLYLEAFSTNTNKKASTPSILCRIGRKFSPIISPEADYGNFVPQLVLYSPFTAQEVADFFRLGLAFSIPVFITDENNRANDLIKKVSKRYYKGLDKIEYHITPSLSEFLEEYEETCFGFSLWGTTHVIELPKFIERVKSSTSERKDISLIFGNEETGLPLFVRKKIPMFRIGIQTSEPLRASHAAAYVLGMLFSHKKT